MDRDKKREDGQRTPENDSAVTELGPTRQDSAWVRGVRSQTGSHGDLRTQSQAHELDRQMSSLRIRIFWVQYLALPVLVLATVAMVVGLVLGVGPRGAVLGGTLALAGAAAGLGSFLRSDRERVEELRSSRAARSLVDPDGALSDEPGELVESGDQ